MNDDEFDKLQDEYDLCGVDARLRDFADAIEAAEREACARLCKAYADRHAKHDDDTKAQAWMMLQCAAEIRRRSNAPVQARTREAGPSPGTGCYTADKTEK